MNVSLQSRLREKAAHEGKDGVSTGDVAYEIRTSHLVHFLNDLLQLRCHGFRVRLLVIEFLFHFRLLAANVRLPSLLTR